jgi:hypothetical protein
MSKHTPFLGHGKGLSVAWYLSVVLYELLRPIQSKMARCHTRLDKAKAFLQVRERGPWHVIYYPKHVFPIALTTGTALLWYTFFSLLSMVVCKRLVGLLLCKVCAGMHRLLGDAPPDV